MSQYLILLAIIPLACFQLTKIYRMRNRWLINGIATGLVIAPVSFGLLQFTYIPVIGKVLGFIGLIANLTHGSIGYFCLVGSGIIAPTALITATELVMINLVNAVLFSYCYGMIGYAIDRKLEEESTETEHVRVIL
ncbi:MAG: hypothetical protein BM485_11045 [Desulfobulbaceae bacterium DB1]|nr:MAG: hypothetical protein BM485_11045 [Desulfobulbaceae bacterium DB1]